MKMKKSVAVLLSLILLASSSIAAPVFAIADTVDAQQSTAVTPDTEQGNLENETVENQIPTITSEEESAETAGEATSDTITEASSIEVEEAVVEEEVLNDELSTVEEPSIKPEGDVAEDQSSSSESTEIQPRAPAVSEQETADLEDTVVDKADNSFEPAEAVILAGKVLYGKKLVGGEFDFELVDKYGSVVSQTQNDSNGNVYFDSIYYDEPGTYKYTIREIIGDDPTILYDHSEFLVSVHVAGDADELFADPEYERTPIFVNNYIPGPGQVAISAEKVLWGKELDAGEFDFELVDEYGDVVSQAQNDSDGDILFEPITYEEPGVYEYVIREVIGDESNIVYDNSEFMVSVYVEAGEELAAFPEYAENPTFENAYVSGADQVVLEAEKVLYGKELTEGEFDFELVDEYGDVVSQAQNDSDGNIYFGSIEFDEAGIYVYTIREVIGDESNVIYDDSEFVVSVYVEEEAGELLAFPEYEEDTIFVNFYEGSDLGSFVLKKVDEETKDLLAGAEFELRNLEGDVIREGIVTGADGLAIVSDLEPGEYQLIETKAPEGYQLDRTPKEIAVEDNQFSETSKVVEITNRKNEQSTQLNKVEQTTNNYKKVTVSKTSDKKSELPKTGSTTADAFANLGIFIVLIVLPLLIYRRKNSKRE